MQQLAPSETSKPMILSIANQKGGVGKTTTVVNVGAGLAQRGYRVLVLDFDIQANATHILFRPLQEDEPNLAEALLEDVHIDELIRETSTPNLYLAGSGETMVRVDLALAGMLGREETLKRVIEESTIASSMDFILIDTSPYLGLLTVNALVASDYVIIPVSCEYLPMLGLKLFLSTIRTVQKRLNHKLEVLGYLLTMYDRREKITFEVERILRKHFGDAVFPRPIRINTRHKASPAHHQTIFQYEGENGKGAEDYRLLSGELLRRLELPESIRNDLKQAQALEPSGVTEQHVAEDTQRVTESQESIRPQDSVTSSASQAHQTPEETLQSSSNSTAPIVADGTSEESTLREDPALKHSASSGTQTLTAPSESIATSPPPNWKSKEAQPPDTPNMEQHAEMEPSKS